MAFSDTWLFLVGTLVFAVGALVASLLHLSLFSIDSLSTWLWFIGFGVMALALGFWTVMALRDSRALAEMPAVQMKPS